MESLVIANIRHRPMRTAVSIFGVALGVVLVLLMTGLASGIIQERAERDASVGAEIIFRHSGTTSLSVSSSALSLPVEYGQRLLQIKGVKMVTPIGQYVQSGAGGFGFRSIDAIDFDSYRKISGIRIIAGSEPKSEDDVIVDIRHARNNRVKPGDKIEILNQSFRIAGVYAPEIGSRVKMQLSKLQSLMSAPDRCTLIYVKCENPSEQEEVAHRILAQLPDNHIIFTRDIPALYSRSFPALRPFLNVVTFVALTVSTLTILLAMYTAVTERTREIGILKSLGASRRFIIFTVEKEALLISGLGLTVGYLLANIARIGITNLTPLQFISFEPRWIIITATVGIFAGLVGALYPALRAAQLDAVVALSYE